jgi:hypothetical protein
LQIPSTPSVDVLSSRLLFSLVLVLVLILFAQLPADGGHRAAAHGYGLVSLSESPSLMYSHSNSHGETTPPRSTKVVGGKPRPRWQRRAGGLVQLGPADSTTRSQAPKLTSSASELAFVDR